MISFLIAVVTRADVDYVLSYIAMAIEIVLVLIRFLQYIVEPESRFGMFLQKLFKGITFLKTNTSKKDDKNKEKEEK